MSFGGTNIDKSRGWVFPNNGQDLRIGVPYRASYPQFVSKDKAVNLLPYPLLYRFIPFGNGYENPNYTELVEKVASNEFDAAVGDIAIVAARTEIVDFRSHISNPGLSYLHLLEKLNQVQLLYFVLLPQKYSQHFRSIRPLSMALCGSNCSISYIASLYIDPHDEYARSLYLVLKGGVMAIVDELPYVELFMSTNRRFTIVGRGSRQVAGDLHFTGLPTGHRHVNRRHSEALRGGELKRIHDKWLIRSSCSSKSTKIISSQLDLHSFWALFAICGVACFLPLLAYFIKIIRCNSFSISLLMSLRRSQRELKLWFPSLGKYCSHLSLLQMKSRKIRRPDREEGRAQSAEEYS
ncbi:hypothetical protein HPP92_022542 [Vanilla planifolia]|uniref:Ionotropic glutamate receptor C-terminal domain-containing protein n=1 Tax=Vanilla planifolia TaxID=51239 RepID=A0A835PNR2_VANPL|nr:hypothetical protein HPP92_022542 [Vanilla planifolia]